MNGAQIAIAVGVCGVAGLGGLGAALADPVKPAPAATAPAATGSDEGGVTERDRVDVAPAGHAFKHLQIDNPLGDVRVEGYDGTAIRIETHKHAPDEDTLDRLHVSLIPNPDGTVRIATTADGGREAKPVRRADVRIDFVVRAPRDVPVDVTVGAGKLDIEGMEAGGDLDSASGPISVRHASGNLYTHSVSGETILAEVFGSVDAESLASNVQLDGIAGSRLVASVDRGTIDGRRVRARDVELTSTDGAITLEAEPAPRGIVRIATLRGDVDVRLHRHGAVVVRATGAKVDFGAQQAQILAGGWREATFGAALGAATDAAAIELRSRYGNVVFAIVE